MKSKQKWLHTFYYSTAEFKADWAQLRELLAKSFHNPFKRYVCPDDIKAPVYAEVPKKIVGDNSTIFGGTSNSYAYFLHALLAQGLLLTVGILLANPQLIIAASIALAAVGLAYALKTPEKQLVTLGVGYISMSIWAFVVLSELALGGWANVLITFVALGFAGAGPIVIGWCSNAFHSWLLGNEVNSEEPELLIPTQNRFWSSVAAQVAATLSGALLITGIVAAFCAPALLPLFICTVLGLSLASACRTFVDQFNWENARLGFKTTLALKWLFNGIGSVGFVMTLLSVGLSMTANPLAALIAPHLLIAGLAYLACDRLVVPLARGIASRSVRIELATKIVDVSEPQEAPSTPTPISRAMLGLNISAALFTVSAMYFLPLAISFAGATITLSAIGVLAGSFCIGAWALFKAVQPPVSSNILIDTELENDVQPPQPKIQTAVTPTPKHQVNTGASPKSSPITQPKSNSPTQFQKVKNYILLTGTGSQNLTSNAQDIGQ